MHILFLTDNFPPEVNAPASRTFDHCREWVRAGEQVTVVTCAPNFPNGRVFAGYRNRLWQEEEIDGIRVIRVWSYITRNEGFIKRILDYMSFMAAAFLASLFVRRVDVVIGTSPQFFTAIAAYATGLVKRTPWIFELRDIWPESIKAVGALKDGMILRTLERLELFLYKRARMVVAVTNSFRRTLASRGIDAEKIEVVTNGVDFSLFTPLEADQKIIARHDLGEAFVAGYVGTHGMAHGLDTVLDAAKILQDQHASLNIKILMIGDGSERARLKSRAANEGIRNIVFVDMIPKAEVSRYLSIMHVSIVHLKRLDLFKTVIPSKIFECMGMGLPIVIGVEGEAAEIVEDNDIGLIFEPDNAEELVERLLCLRNDTELRARFSSNGPVAAQAYDRNALAMRMLEAVRQAARAKA